MRPLANTHSRYTAVCQRKRLLKSIRIWRNYRHECLGTFELTALDNCSAFWSFFKVFDFESATLEIEQ